MSQLISKEEKLEETKPADDLLNLEGMDSKLAYTLASKQITTRDDLADLSTDELMEISELSEEQASQLIVEARKHWFEEEE